MMETQVHRTQCLFTAAGSKQAADASIEQHFRFDADDVVPQVGDFVGFGSATTSRSRFVVRERDFLWEADERAASAPVLLLMLRYAGKAVGRDAG